MHPIGTSHDQALSDALPHIVWITDEHGGIEFFNQKWEDYTGLSRDERDPHALGSVVHPDDREAASQSIKTAHETGGQIEVEYRLRRKDGEYRWHLARTTPVRGPEGGLVRRYGTAVDVHEYVLNRQSSQAKERELNEFVETIPFIAWMANNVTNEVFYNRRFYEYHGLPAGAAAPDWQDHVHPEDLPFLVESHVKVSTTGESIEGEARIKGAAGEYRWHLMRSHGIKDTNGRVIKRVGTAVDIHDQKMEKEALQKTGEKLIQIQAITSELSKALTESQVLEVIQKQVFKAFHATGGMLFEPTENGKSLKLSLAHGYDAEVIEKYAIISVNKKVPVCAVFKESKPLFLENLEEILVPYPEARPAVEDTGIRAFVAVPMVLSRKKLGVLHFSYKYGRKFPENTRRLMVTLVNHCAEALERARLYDLSEKAVKARDNLISVSAHELLTPVTGSKLHLQLLQKKLIQGADLTKEDIIRMAAQTERNLDRLAILVSDMLDLSRIDLGKLTLRREQLSLSKVVCDAMERALPMIESSGCTLKSSIDLEVIARVDQYRFEQVVNNLISNACRYSPGKPIEVSLKRHSPRLAHFIVADHGVGIRKEDQSRIFERFERASSVNEKTGLGLGLFIVKQIVEAHAGSVWVESDLGKGAQFIVELPIIEEAKRP